MKPWQAWGLHYFRHEQLIQETVMKFHIGKNLFVMDFSSEAFSWFQGETERMSLTSISVLFLQFSLFARRLEAV